ncbi:hypothetical protein FRC02_005437 [Tulasnella sp. 418]|nr:hypothetical protein FRC02_005437 [Tulasnella sp. 418]
MFLIDNHEKWIQPQAFEWFRKARDNMDFSKDPPRLSPSIDQLKAYKDFVGDEIKWIKRTFNNVVASSSLRHCCGTNRIPTKTGKNGPVVTYLLNS